jgi:deoxyribonuclease V
VRPKLSHRWDLDPREASRLQARLASRVRVRGALPREPFLVAGCDASGSGRWAHGDERLVAAVIVFRYPGWEIVDAASVSRPSPFPYVLAHPRGFGLAAHLGVLFDLQSVGVAKSRLVGEYREPGSPRGCATQLRVAGKVVGRVVRTRSGVKPLFVSPGHRIGIEEAARAVLRMTDRYRLPEPTRLADQWVGRLRRGETALPASSSS